MGIVCDVMIRSGKDGLEGRTVQQGIDYLPIYLHVWFLAGVCGYDVYMRRDEGDDEVTTGSEWRGAECWADSRIRSQGWARKRAREKRQSLE